MDSCGVDIGRVAVVKLWESYAFARVSFSISIGDRFFKNVL